MKKKQEPQLLGHALIDRYVPVITHFWVQAPNDIDIKTFNPAGITYETTTFGDRSRTVSNELTVQLIIKIFTTETKKTQLGELITQNVFLVKDLPNYLRPKAEPNVEAGLMVALVGISISTARGILLVKGAGTPLQFFNGNILPLINPAALKPIATEVKPKKETNKKSKP